MGVTKEQLEDKLKLFITKHTELLKVINDNIVLSNKIEGAIEAIQLILKESQATVPSTDQTNTTQDANKA
jgi:hypothetical protein